MPAPDEIYLDLTPLQATAGQPVDEVLMQTIRKDLSHLQQYLGASYIAAKDHNHDGINSAEITTITANASVAILSLNTGDALTAGTLNLPTSSITLLPAGIYACFGSLNQAQGVTFVINFGGTSVASSYPPGFIISDGVNYSFNNPDITNPETIHYLKY